MRVILLGAPGAGKGTYASRLSKILKIPAISTGDLLRVEVEAGTQLGRKAKSYINTGKLVPDDLVIKLLKRRIKKQDCKKGFILDGFPRNLNQAKALEKITKIDKVINYVVNNKVIIRRLCTRVTCTKCGEIFNLVTVKPKREGYCDCCNSKLYIRDDQKPEVIQERIDIYKKQTKPLIDYYKKKKILKQVDANLGIEDPQNTIIEDSLKILQN